MYKVALIGCGMVSDRLIQEWEKCKDAAIYSVCDIDEAKVRNAYEKTKARKWYTDYRKALRDSVDIVEVALPPYICRDVVIDACNAKKHVLCEKPMALNVNDAQAMCESAYLNDVILGVRTHFRLRYHSIKKLIDEGAIGTPYFLLSDFCSAYLPNSFFPEWPPWGWEKRSELGGGILAAHAPHSVDLMIWLVGSKIHECHVVGTQASFITDFSAEEVNVEDTAQCIIRFENKAIGSALNTWKLKSKLPDFIIAGTTGEITVKGEKYFLDDRQGTIKEYTMESAILENGESSMESFFVHSVKTGAPYISPGADQIEVAKLLEQQIHL